MKKFGLKIFRNFIDFIVNDCKDCCNFVKYLIVGFYDIKNSNVFFIAL